MNLINALSISIGLLAAVATYLSFGTSLGTVLGLQVWALFIGWGSFYHAGGKTDGLTKSAINHIWGAGLAAIALFAIGTIAGSVLVTSIIVGISVVILVLGAHAPALATIPAGVYGYASTAGFCLLTAVALGDFVAVLKGAIIVVLSLIVGNIFGFVSEKGAGMLVKADA